MRAAQDARLSSVRRLRGLGRLRHQEGQVLPLVALLLIVILGMAAFAIDVSALYFDQRHLQTQADAAVEAGAQQFLSGSADCEANKPNVEQVEANYAGVADPISGATIASSPINSNNESGKVIITPDASCGGAGGSYVDATVTNSKPPTFFSGIFGAHPTVSAHARASLEQITSEGGSGVLPYSISESQAVYNNQLITLPINKGGNIPLQGLICDGGMMPSTTAAADTKMIDLEINGCPKTGINKGDTCPPVQLSPPTCLYQFTRVDEGAGYDAGEVPRFDSGVPKGDPRLKCTSPFPVPPNNYPQYLSQTTLVPGDPRVITIFIVPDGSYSSTTSNLIPIVGYALFYVTSWDHDPCANKLAGTSGNGIDTPNPGGGSLSGYFIAHTTAEGSDVSSDGTPCDPIASEAWTYNCTWGLTQ